MIAEQIAEQMLRKIVAEIAPHNDQMDKTMLDIGHLINANNPGLTEKHYGYALMGTGMTMFFKQCLKEEYTKEEIENMIVSVIVKVVTS